MLIGQNLFLKFLTDNCPQFAEAEIPTSGISFPHWKGLL